MCRLHISQPFYLIDRYPLRVCLFRTNTFDKIQFADSKLSLDVFFISICTFQIPTDKTFFKKHGNNDAYLYTMSVENIINFQDKKFRSVDK